MRDATSAQHAEIDALVGEFRSAGDYYAYLRGIHAFRTALEEDGAAPSAWTPTKIAADARRDLDDLQLRELPAKLVPAPSSYSALLGRGYVLEGSGLGARVLMRAAGALGFDKAFGARHLWRQSNAQRNWQSLLTLLEHSDIDLDIAIDEANLTFMRARAAMTAAAQKA